MKSRKDYDRMDTSLLLALRICKDQYNMFVGE